MASDPLIAAACLFALITGANDGASLVATNLASKALRPLVALLLLAVAVVVGPYLLGTAVASTLASGLVGFDRAGGRDALLVAVLVAVGLVGLLARLGLPTSVMQALTGAILGAGIGRGLPVDLSLAARVLVVLFVAPLLAGGLGRLVVAALGRIRPRHGVRRHVRILQAGSWLGQCVAYAANDAQKMVAVFAVALGVAASGPGGGAGLVPAAQVAIGVCFTIGALAGASRLGGRVGRLLQVTPMTAVGAGYGSATAVLASAALGAPVSMAQANASALIGAQSLVRGSRRIRWEQAVRILSTWVTTMPSAFGCAAVVGWATR